MLTTNYKEPSTCTICKNSFVPKRWKGDSREYQCRPCRRIYEKAWRDKRKANGNPVKSTKMSREWHAEYRKEYRERFGVREQMATNQRKYRTDPRLFHRYKARELSRKVPKKPCEVCGAHQAERHHDNYDKPLDIRWLCKTHHSEHHAKAYEDKP